jgi:HK97 family phage major capsid protein
MADEAIRAAREATMRQLGISQRERRGYSVTAALLALSKPGTKCYETDVSEELARKTGRKGITNNSILIPSGINLTRDMSVGSASAGGYLVGSANVGGSFIDMLRPALLASELGATFMGGLRGDVAIPKQTAAGTAYWLPDETTAITESTPTIGQMNLTPKNVGAYTEFSRQLLMQSDPSVDLFIVNDLVHKVSEAIDAAVFAGTGTGGQPYGVANASGLGSVAAGTFDYAKALEFVVDVASANALNQEACAYVTTPTIAQAAIQRQEVSGTYSPVWKGNIREGRVAGLRARTSTNVTAGTVFFGDWSQVVIGEWGVIEVALNPYADFKSGTLAIRVMHSVDIGIRQPGAFSMGTSIT